MIQNPNLDKSYLTNIGNEITLNSSKLILDHKLVIPKGYIFKVYPGTTIDLINDASILSYSPIEMIGNKENQIVIKSSDKTGQGLLIINSERESKLDYVLFKDLTNPKDFGWEIPGAITFYESNVLINNTIFDTNYSEDFLNTIRSEFQILNTSIINSQSDAFDSDFSNGEVLNCKFSNIGNDAIDCSGSNLKIKNIVINQVEDKAISGGENSVISGNLIDIDNVEIGITSKDLSKLSFQNININNSKVAFCAFQKKPEYGPASIISHKINLNNIDVPYLVEEKSKVFVDDIEMDITPGIVEDMLYGIMFGKSSK